MRCLEGRTRMCERHLAGVGGYAPKPLTLKQESPCPRYTTTLTPWSSPLCGVHLLHICADTSSLPG